MNKLIKISFSLLFMSCQQNIDPNLKVYGIEDFFDNVLISGGQLFPETLMWLWSD